MEFNYDSYFLKNDINSLSFPLSLQFEFNEQCNLKCPYCYNNSLFTNNKKFNFEKEKWLKVFNDTLESGGVFQCILSGGEPLLFYEEILQLAKKLQDDGTGFVLITNGTLLEEKIVRKLALFKWFWIQVSLDSCIPGVHDKIRGMEGAFLKIEEGIKLLLKYKLPVTVSTVLTDDNINDIDKIIAYVSNLGVDTILFSMVLPTGRATLKRDYILQDEEYEKIKKMLNHFAKEYKNINIKLAANYNDYVDATERYKPTSLLIRPNGDVKADCLSTEIIGNAFTDNIKDIWNAYLEK